MPTKSKFWIKTDLWLRRYRLTRESIWPSLRQIVTKSRSSPLLAPMRKFGIWRTRRKCMRSAVTRARLQTRVSCHSKALLQSVLPTLHGVCMTIRAEKLSCNSKRMQRLALSSSIPMVSLWQLVSLLAISESTMWETCSLPSSLKARSKRLWVNSASLTKASSWQLPGKVKTHAVCTAYTKRSLLMISSKKDWLWPH